MLSHAFDMNKTLSKATCYIFGYDMAFESLKEKIESSETKEPLSDYIALQIFLNCKSSSVL